MTLADVEPTTIWHEPPPVSREELAIHDSPLISTLLSRRGIANRDEARKFLDPARQSLADPFLLPDMDRAVARIRQAIEQHEMIGVFGDYDVDGLSSTAMLYRALTQELGAAVVPMIPHRANDGYGLNDAAVDRMLVAGVKLLITVDCGSSDVAEIERALQLGLDVIVLDHHVIHGGLPADVAFVSARRPENRYPETELAAVGVAFALVRALIDDEAAEKFLPYAALGTVADVVPLQRENRVLAARGIELIRRWGLPGIKRLCHHAGIDRAAIDSYAIGFVIGPRINAAGRMDDPDLALQMLLANTLDDADPYARRLDELNRKRQYETRRIEAAALQQIDAMGGAWQRFSLVVDGHDWPVGVAGIVAGRLAEQHRRPTIVFERGETISRGSARSGGVVNIFEVLQQNRQHLIDFGGHTAAAGMEIETRNLEVFRESIEATVADMLKGQRPRHEITLDAHLPSTELTLTTCELLQQLEPFGAGNEQPVLLIRDVSLSNIRTTRNGKHLQLDVTGDDGRRHKGIFFRAGDRLSEIETYRKVDLAAKVRLDTWGGRRRVEIQIEDVRSTRE